MFYCASVTFRDLVSSSDGGAGRGRHQDLIQGEARREGHSSGETLLSHTTPDDLLIEPGFIPVAPERRAKGLVTDRCL